jgi:dienelactone hydrolase
MASIPRFVRMATVASMVATAAACGGSDGDEGDLIVTSQVLSDSTTPDVRVLAPEGEGPWPVVVALHGVGGSGEDMVELATRLAAGGTVVYAPTYHSDLATMDDLVRAGDDISCAYQLALRTAAEYGGDLTLPVTAVGWSLGADLVLLGSLQEQTTDTGGRCPGETPRPDVVVGISGCYYEFEDEPIGWFDDATSWNNHDLDIHLVAGDRDTVCPAWQTDRLATALHDADYRPNVVQLEAANHFAPIFHDDVDGDWQVIADDPPGEQTVQVILDSIAAAGDAPQTG